MSNDRRVLVYGANGYTGKIVCEGLAKLEIPFYMVGRTLSKLEDALRVVEQRYGAPVDAEIAVASNEPEQLRPLFEKVDVVINIIGPFMQLGWPVVETALAAGCHYLDITGEQDWTHAVKEKYGQAFADKGLLLCPSCSLVWGMGAVCAEMVLEHEGIDSLDIVYQTDHGLPSDASTKSFLRMACNESAQQYLELNELKPWQTDLILQAVLPHRASTMAAHPWGGGCEPVWYKDDERVRNCRVITAVPDNMLQNALAGIRAFNEEAAHLPQEEREAWTNAMGEQMATGEPSERDHEDVQRCVVVCYGQGRHINRKFVLNMPAPYSRVGDICAESARRLLGGQLKAAGFQSIAGAFGHRELLQTFHDRGYCDLQECS